MPAAPVAGTAAARSFPGTPAHLAAARSFVCSCLPASCPRRDDAALLTSELATNAVLHSASGLPGGSYQVLVDLGAHTVEVTVIDQGPAPVPARRPDEEGGFGLGLVAELADAYDSRPGPAGRTVWCRLDW